MQFCVPRIFRASTPEPPKIGPKKIIFLIAQARAIVVFYISRYLSDKYFDIVWGCIQGRALVVRGSPESRAVLGFKRQTQDGAPFKTLKFEHFWYRLKYSLNFHISKTHYFSKTRIVDQHENLQLNLH